MAFACRYALIALTGKWQVKMASKAETIRTKKSANGFVLCDHEHEKSELINMTKNCEKELREIASNVKNRQICDFSQFSQIWLNPQLGLVK